MHFIYIALFIILKDMSPNHIIKGIKNKLKKYKQH